MLNRQMKGWPRKTPQNAIIDQLEELIKSFGVQIRREPIKQDEDKSIL
jgi:hypothetical protein